MEFLGRKRKGVEENCVENDRQLKKKCVEEYCLADRQSRAAAPSGGSASEFLGRGHKRKIGCIESATQFGRKKKLGKEYDMGRMIGQGNFGSVRLCRSKKTGEQFACKVLPKNGAESVHREVEIMQHISGHANVVNLNAVFDDSECAHLVMELCSGGCLLDQMTKEGRYSEERAAHLIRDLTLVIKYCHDFGVVHRDIKPENILLSESGKIKLADFGLAMRFVKGQKLSGVVGTPAYMAPEVLSGDYSEKVDIWSVGVLLHVLLVGTLPFIGASREAIFESVKTTELNFRGGIWDSVSPLARDLLSRMLTINVSSRLVADDILRHPWILFYTECPALIPITSRTLNRSAVVPMSARCCQGQIPPSNLNQMTSLLSTKGGVLIKSKALWNRWKSCLYRPKSSLWSVFREN